MTEQNTQQQNSNEKLDFAQVVQKQISELKEEVVQRIEALKTQFPLSQADLIELKDTLKAEMNTVLDDVTQVSKALKQDLSDISIKHKEQLSDTIKHAKETVVDAFSAINLSQPKSQDTQKDA